MVLLPLAMFGQRFELSEQVGAVTRIESGNDRSGSTAFAYTYDHVSGGGISDLIKATYLIKKHFSLGLLYQYSIITTPTHSLGIVGDFKFKIVNFGFDLRDTKVVNGTYVIYPVTFNNALAFGSYVGLSEKISRHLYLKQTAGVSYYNLKSAVEVPYGKGTFTSTDTQPVTTVYVVAGISYRF